MGVAPQRERRPRIIIDHSHHGLNDLTKKQAADAMQCGRALDRILFAIHTATREAGPLRVIKIDLSDGFHRTGLRATDALKLGVVFPTGPKEPPLVAMPSVLPMGWMESLPHFCTATETIADLANCHQAAAWKPPIHPLECVASNPAVHESRTHGTEPPPPERTGQRVKAHPQTPQLLQH